MINITTSFKLLVVRATLGLITKFNYIHDLYEGDHMTTTKSIPDEDISATRQIKKELRVAGQR